METSRRVLGEDHPNTLSSMANLGSFDVLMDGAGACGGASDGALWPFSSVKALIFNSIRQP
jgi:hypothetical protein